MRQRKAKKLPPKGKAGDKKTEEQIMQLIVKRHPKIIKYLSEH